MSSIDYITTFNLPKSIKEFIFKKPEDTDAEAFLYKVTVNDVKKYYGGFHTGYVGDGYWWSSTDDELAEFFRNDDSDIKVEILDFGTTDEMKDAENKLLIDNKAADSDEWFNKWNGYKKTPGIDKQKCKDFIKKLKSGKFQTEERKVMNLTCTPRLQSRYKDQDGAQLLIASDVDDNGGSNTKADSILVWEHLGKFGITSSLKNKVNDDLIGDGNTTIFGYKRSKHGKKSSLKINFIPLEIGKYFSKTELLWIANTLNPRNKKVETPMSAEDGAKYLFESAKNDKTPIRCRESRTILTDWNFTNGQISGILDKAEEWYEEWLINQNTNFQFCNYKAEPYLSIKDEKVENKNKIPGLYCKAFSSESVRLDRAIVDITKINKLIENGGVLKEGKIIKTYKPGEYKGGKKIKDVLLLIFINASKDDKLKKKWVSQSYPEIQDACEFAFTNNKINYDIQVLPMKEAVGKDESK